MIKILMAMEDDQKEVGPSVAFDMDQLKGHVDSGGVAFIVGQFGDAEHNQTYAEVYKYDEPLQYPNGSYPYAADMGMSMPTPVKTIEDAVGLVKETAEEMIKEAREMGEGQTLWPDDN